MERIDDLLMQFPFFQGLPPAYLSLIAGCATNAHFKPGEYLLREGDPANRFFAIRKGRVAVETYVPSRGPVVLQTMSAGEILGWSWLFPPYVYQFDARARDEVSTTAFDGACLRGKCEADPALGYEFMKRLARAVSSRLEGTRRQLLDVYGPGANR
jgi:CRP/FNR family transcriptional regulator, cyclic AMP receptor protein